MEPVYDQSYFDRYYLKSGSDSFIRRYAMASALARGAYGLRVGRVLEFGAGLGLNLTHIQADERWAVDVSQASRAACEGLGVTWRDDLAAVPDGAFDLVMACHSLEHVRNPEETLRRLLMKTAPNGRFLCVVPVERLGPCGPLDRLTGHLHLFSWTPETLKNLLLVCGWQVESISLMNGFMLHRTLPLLPEFPVIYAAARRLIDCVGLRRVTEIVAWCRCSTTAHSRFPTETPASSLPPEFGR